MNNKSFNEVFNLKHYEKFNCLIVKPTIRTRCTLNNLKHNNDGGPLDWLIRQSIMVTKDHWKKETSANVGFFIMKHPTATWLEDMRPEV